MFEKYKAFLFRGNLLDLAVAFILGAAFNAVVQSLANDVIMRPISRLLGYDDVAAWTVAGIGLGAFLAALLSFVVLATVLFVTIQAAERFDRPGPEEVPAPDSDEVVLLWEIRDLLSRQGPASGGSPRVTAPSRCPAA